MAVRRALPRLARLARAPPEDGHPSPGPATWTDLATRTSDRAKLVLRWSAGLLFLAICAWLYLRTEPPAERIFTEYVYHYIYPTDLRLARVYFSRPICALALLGLTLVFVLRRCNWSAKAVILTLLPHAFLIGNMYDLFMTRYMLIAICPLVAIGITACFDYLPLRGHARAAVHALASLLVCTMLFHNRLPMVTTTEYRGLSRYLTHFADAINDSNGILLAEYPRLAVPLEHFHGIPMLGIDNEQRSNYEPALAAWQTVMDAHPGRPAFFLTPFGTPVSDRFIFEPAMTRRFD